MAQTTMTTVLELDIACPKCKTKVFKAVASIKGVDTVVMDEGKGTMAMTGTADSCFIIRRIRKALSCVGKSVNIVRVGPPPKPDAKKKPDQTKKPDQKKPEEKKSDPHPCPCPYPCPCPPYNPWSYGYVVMAPETNAPCSIL